MDRYELEYHKMSGKSNFPSYIYIEADSLETAIENAKEMIKDVKPILTKIRKLPNGEWHSLEERI